jgi:hypothetical protein
MMYPFRLSSFELKDRAELERENDRRRRGLENAPGEPWLELSDLAGDGDVLRCRDASVSPPLRFPCIIVGRTS